MKETGVLRRDELLLRVLLEIQKDLAGAWIPLIPFALAIRAAELTFPSRSRTYFKEGLSSVVQSRKLDADLKMLAQLLLIRFANGSVQLTETGRETCEPFALPALWQKAFGLIITFFETS